MKANQALPLSVRAVGTNDYKHLSKPDSSMEGNLRNQCVNIVIIAYFTLMLHLSHDSV